jgi:Flp pilus assembly protein TadG
MHPRAILRRFRERPLGQSLAEFALLLPVFLVVVSAAIDFGRVAYARVTIANVAREASFQAAQTPTSYLAGQPCSAGNEDDNMVICRAILESNGSVITVAPADVAMACSPTCDRAMGNTVTVTATGRFNLLTPVIAMFFGGTTITFSSTSTNQIAALPLPEGAELDPTPPPGDIATPDLTSRTEAEALDLISGAGLTAGTRYEEYNTFVAAGSVTSQSPAPGTMVAAGSAVSYVISKGPAPAPDCTGVSAGFEHSTSPSTNKSPVTVTVTDTTIYNPACPTIWVWDWGDGSATYVGQNPGSHVYRNQSGPAGNTKKFNLTLTVTSGTFTDTSGAAEIQVIK